MNVEILEGHGGPRTDIDGIVGFLDCGRRGLMSVGEDMGVGSVAKEWLVSSEIWPWKLGVGEEASSPVRGDLARDEGWVVEARVWVGVFSSPVREYQSKRLKLVCLIWCFK